jgi:hypothetical protein
LAIISNGGSRSSSVVVTATRQLGIILSRKASGTKFASIHLRYGSSRGDAVHAVVVTATAIIFFCGGVQLNATTSNVGLPII